MKSNLQLLATIIQVSPVHWPHSDRRKMSAINWTERECGEGEKPRSRHFEKTPTHLSDVLFLWSRKTSKSFFVAVHFGRDFYWKCDIEFPLILNLTAAPTPTIGFAESSFLPAKVNRSWLFNWIYDVICKFTTNWWMNLLSPKLWRELMATLRWKIGR